MVEDSDDIIKRKHLARRIANIVHQTADPPIPFDNWKIFLWNIKEHKNIFFFKNKVTLQTSRTRRLYATARNGPG